MQDLGCFPVFFQVLGPTIDLGAPTLDCPDVSHKTHPMNIKANNYATIDQAECIINSILGLLLHSPYQGSATNCLPQKLLQKF
jgi:hypothetical protein